MTESTETMDSRSGIVVESPVEAESWFSKTMFGYIRASYLVPFAVILTFCICIDAVPGGFLGGFVICSVYGLFMQKIGDIMPFVRTFLGGGSFLAIFGAAFMAYFNVFPAGTTKILNSFVREMDAITWGTVAVICGSILTMNRRLLIRAGVLYFLPIMGGITAAFAFAGIIGVLMGGGWRESVLFVALPIMGGGTSAGAVPMSQSYGAMLSRDAGAYLSLMMPAVALGNAASIVAAGMLKSLGEKFPSLTGNGVMMYSKGNSIKDEEKEYMRTPITIESLGRGFVFTGILLALGMILYKIVPQIHFFAWTILLCAVIKIFGKLPKELEISSGHWYQFSVKLTVPVALFAIGYVYTDMTIVLASLTPAFVLMVVATILGAMVGAGVIGYFLGFYPIEAAITAGLCMSNMGGTGDVATLGAANRMELIPFASISSRLGGALIIIIASILLPIIGGGL